MKLYQNYIKRGGDIVLSSVAFLLLSPLFLIAYLLVLRSVGRPVLFKQVRPGLNEKKFRMFKFRTMTDEADENGNLLPDHVRLTKTGEFLRKTSLDELPELINIFKGDMSIVGPRPLLVRYLPHYTERESKRHLVRPGLTGLAQVSGRNLIEWDQRLEKDVEYVENVSFKLDVKIILKTAWIVVNREDVELNTLEDFDVQRMKEKEELQYE